jgi:hypothetical protein
VERGATAGNRWARPSSISMPQTMQAIAGANLLLSLFCEPFALSF